MFSIEVFKINTGKCLLNLQTLDHESIRNKRAFNHGVSCAYDVGLFNEHTGMSVILETGSLKIYA